MGCSLWAKVSAVCRGMEREEECVMDEKMVGRRMSSAMVLVIELGQVYAGARITTIGTF